MTGSHNVPESRENKNARSLNERVSTIRNRFGRMMLTARSNAEWVLAYSRLLVRYWIDVFPFRTYQRQSKRVVERATWTERDLVRDGYPPLRWLLRTCSKLSTGQTLSLPQEMSDVLPFLTTVIPQMRDKTKEIPAQQREKILNRWHSLCYLWERTLHHISSDSFLLLFVTVAHELLYTPNISIRPHRSLASRLVTIGCISLSCGQYDQSYNAAVLSLRLLPRNVPSSDQLKENAVRLLMGSFVKLVEQYESEKNDEQKVWLFLQTVELMNKFISKEELQRILTTHQEEVATFAMTFQRLFEELS